MSWALRLAGPVLLALAVMDAVLRRRARAGRRRVTGRIVGWSSHDTPHPTIRFTTHDGREIESRLSANIDIGLYPCKEVPVWYDPARPEDFHTQVWWFGAPGLALAIAGTVLTALGMMAW